jgi:hypothetical protein
MLVMLWQYPQVSRTLFVLSLGFPVYYLVLSLLLLQQQRERRALQ